MIKTSLALCAASAVTMSCAAETQPSHDQAQRTPQFGGSTKAQNGALIDTGITTP